MNRTGWGLILIFIGVLFFARSINLFPENFYTLYLNLVRHYWPILLILLGIKSLLLHEEKVFSQVIHWIIFIMIVLWVFCWLWGRPGWVV